MVRCLSASLLRGSSDSGLASPLSTAAPQKGQVKSVPDISLAFVPHIAASHTTLLLKCDSTRPIIWRLTNDMSRLFLNQCPSLLLLLPVLCSCAGLPNLARPSSLVLDFLDLADPLTEEAAAFAKYGVPANCSSSGADEGSSAQGSTSTTTKTSTSPPSSGRKLYSLGY
jgi:hypothetical protein